MSLTDQPSVLTVCVPGASAEPGALDLNEILAARKRVSAQISAGAPDRAGCGSVQRSNAGSECDDCDDSACGVELAGDLASKSDADARQLRSPGCTCESRLESEMTPEAPDGAATGVTTGVSFFHADSGKKALELLRMLRFDLLVTGDRLPDMPIDHFLRRVRVAWPWQKWAMVGSSITTQDEIAARSLGAMAVFDAPPDWVVLSSLAAIAADKGADQAAVLRPAAAQEADPDRLSRLGVNRQSVTGPIRAAAKGHRAAMLSRRGPKRSAG